MAINNSIGAIDALEWDSMSALDCLVAEAGQNCDALGIASARDFSSCKNPPAAAD